MGIVIKKGEDFSGAPVPEKVTENSLRYGLWEFNRKGDNVAYELRGVSRTGMLEFLERSGYYRLKNDSTIIVCEVGGIVSIVGIEEIKGFIIKHLDDISDDGLSFKFGNRVVRASKLALRETFQKQCHLSINLGNLEYLNPFTKEFLTDDMNTAFFPYKDVVIKVSGTDISAINYPKLDGKCVWNGRIINRKNPLESEQDDSTSKFEVFICNISVGEVSRVDGFRSSMGYLLHNHTRPSIAVATILYDEEVSDGATPNGGTGKGIIAKAIGQMRRVTRIDGKNYRSEDRFKFQLVTDETQIIWLDDPRSDFDFSDLYSCISEGVSFEAKNQATRVFPPQSSPKFIICSNTVIRSNGTSNSRRQRILEVGSHYKDMASQGCSEPIEKEHGGLFFDNDSWDKDEWARFDLFMLKSTQFYLAHGLVKSEPVNVALNELIQHTSTEFVEWVLEQSFEVNIPYDTKEQFEAFKNLHYCDEPQFRLRGFTNMLKKYAVSKGWKHRAKSSNSKPIFTFKVG